MTQIELDEVRIKPQQKLSLLKWWAFYLIYRSTDFTQIERSLASKKVERLNTKQEFDPSRVDLVHHISSSFDLICGWALKCQYWMEFGKFDQKILNDKIIWLSIDLEKHLKFKFQIHRIDCGSQKILNYLTSFKNIAKRPQFNSIQNRIQYSINLLRQFNMRFESKPNIISFSAIKFWLFHLSCGKSFVFVLRFEWSF